LKQKLPNKTEPPLLTIEIQSPSQSPEEMIDKVKQYFQFGVKSSWVVFPALKGVSVYDSPKGIAFFKVTKFLMISFLTFNLI